ncbi:MAG: dTMP kinase [Micavibrio aeruginosavorus]|uniref:Thymidylate kinase n=1 Tax=Micavibrio aeruginosavorus TaxID=349221 RepID=A0A7T5R0T6_9BACT|nr:MAG: dTMP kinase [Micavibrio aeruginosavorus]
MARGIFITLEGGEGAGKSTQIRMLATALEQQGYEVVTTREPGGTPEAEKIRDFLVKRNGGNWTPMAECLLLYAARQMHVEHLIKPALSGGKIVISDRFADSTRAYQSFGHGLPLKTIEDMNRLALGDFAPDITFILDLPVDVGLARAGQRLSAAASQEDRFERLGESFHERLRQGFLAIAARDVERCRIIDATRSIEEIARDLFTHVQGKLA